MSRTKEIGPFSAAPEELGPRLLSDAAFEAAVARLQKGQVCFTSEVMRRRFGDTIVEELWEAHEQPAEPD
jgi:hypothetical protein